MKNSITNRQIVFILFTAVATTSLLAIPKLLAEETGAGGWLTIIVCAVIFGILAVVLVNLNNRFPNLILFEYSQKLVGKFLSYIIAIIYIVYFFAITVYVIQILVNLLTSNFLIKTPPWIMILSSLLVCGYGAYKGIRNVARLFELYAILSIIFILDLHLMMLMQGDVTHIQPIFQPDKTLEYLSEIKSFITPFLGIEVLTVIPFTMQNFRKSKNIAFFSVIGIGLIYVLVALSSIMMVGMNEIVHYKESMLTAIRLIEVPNVEFLKRVDVVYIVVGLMGIHSSIIVFFTSTAEISCKALSKINRKFIVLGIGVLLFISSFLVLKMQNFEKIFSEVIIYYGMATAAIIPIILLIIAKVKNYENEEN